MLRKQLIFPLIKKICEEENIIFKEEPSRGMFGVMIFDDGRKFFIKDVNFNLNYVSSTRITKNKSLTSYFLDLFGYKVPLYTVVYSDEKRKRYKLEDSMENGIKFINEIGYPAILKLNDSSKGRGIYKVYDIDEFIETAKLIFQTTNTFQIQKYYDYNDYRVVVLGDKVISAYQRIPLSIIGDGVSSIRELLLLRQKFFEENGRDTIINFDDIDLQTNIEKLGYSYDSILETGKKCKLRYISNLSAGGECLDLTENIHQDYINLCVNIAHDLNLKLSGIDIMCKDLCSSLDDYIVLEVNSAPGLDNYAYTGQKQEEYVKELYRQVILYIKKNIR
ncbi:MAG: hypothetical protein IJE49_06605 [Agathobacter sp.]|nr:hypothetical protein [Agathobacter sp.]